MAAEERGLDVGTDRLLGRAFYARETLVVARELLGQRVVRVSEGERVSGRITEVEAYIGEEDQASHARPGRTPRNASMYGLPGHAYVYFIYGMHYCLNAVTDREGYPAAILIRGLEPLEGIEVMRRRRGGRSDDELTDGPAKICQALDIDTAFDGVDLCERGAALFIEQDEPVVDRAVARAPRIGVSGDEEARSVPWRFYVAD